MCVCCFPEICPQDYKLDITWEAGGHRFTLCCGRSLKSPDKVNKWPNLLCPIFNTNDIQYWKIPTLENVLLLICWVLILQGEKGEELKAKSINRGLRMFSVWSKKTITSFSPIPQKKSGLQASEPWPMSGVELGQWDLLAKRWKDMGPGTV